MLNSEENIEQLLQEESFVRWIKGEANDRDSELWNRWLRQDPARNAIVEEARWFWNSLTFEEKIPETIKGLNRLRGAIEEYDRQSLSDGSQHKYSGQKKNRIGLWVSVAVVLMLLIAIPFVIQTLGWDPGVDHTGARDLSHATLTASTEYGQIRTLTLWDGSKVILSANTSLRYPKYYRGGELSVELEGKAYFDIKHEKNDSGRTFTVHTSEGKIVVLGTRFNVNTRTEETDVVLEEGKVHLSMADTLGKVKTFYSYTMEPGERALFGLHRNGVDVERIDPSLYTSWRNLELKFDNTPLKEVAHRLNEFYGVEVEFRDEQLMNVQLSGSVTNKNFEVLLQGLRVLLEIPISHRNNTITFG